MGNCTCYPNAGLIKVYFNMTWDGVTEVWLNGHAMEKVTNANGNYYVEIQENSITSLNLSFKQGSSWWHIEEAGQKTWNTDNAITVNWSAGNTYKVTNVNWTYQWDNQEHKWYTCDISQI